MLILPQYPHSKQGTTPTEKVFIFDFFDIEAASSPPHRRIA
jgi:hypothetical protein